uniref:G_PROTEIN_RECEP_F1_2 domain-containing protein n=1 Tax=Steinernema glaseri TaxID=37863 RepID=A0A1I7ZMV4_9BILA
MSLIKDAENNSHLPASNPNPILAANYGIQLGISCMNLLYAILVCAVSSKIDKKDLCRLCTLWQFLTTAASDSFQIVVTSLKISGQAGHRNLGIGWNILLIGNKLLQDNASQVYRVMALLLVFLTYMSYKHPFFYVTILKHSRRNTLFVIGFLILCLHTLVGNTLSTLSEYGFITDDNIVSFIASMITYYSVQVLLIVPVFLMVVLYCMSVYSILQYAKKKASRGESITQQQRQLMSVVLYSTTPNLLLLPPTFQNICFLAIPHMDVEKEPNIPLMKIIHVLDVISRHCAYARIPVLTLSTFLAFSPYRKVLFSSVLRQRTSVRVAEADPNRGRTRTSLR